MSVAVITWNGGFLQSLGPALGDSVSFSYSAYSKRFIFLVFCFLRFSQIPSKGIFLPSWFPSTPRQATGWAQNGIGLGKRMVTEWEWRLYKKGCGLIRGFVPGKDRVGIFQRQSLRKNEGTWVGPSDIVTVSDLALTGHLLFLLSLKLRVTYSIRVTVSSAVRSPQS